MYEYIPRTVRTTHAILIPIEDRHENHSAASKNGVDYEGEKPTESGPETTRSGKDRLQQSGDNFKKSTSGVVNPKPSNTLKHILFSSSESGEPN